MRALNAFLALTVCFMLTSTTYSQTLAERLRQAGSISFRILNADYSITVGPGCVQSFASGTLGAQNVLTVNFLPNSLDFELTLQQVVNSISSDQRVRFVATVSNNGSRITWTAQNIPQPVCAIVSIGGTGNVPFRIDEVYGSITVDLEEISCQADPLGVLGRRVDIRMNIDPSSQMGFNGWVADAVCGTLFFPACARAINLQFAGFGGRCPAGDVNDDGCVNDSDLLIVLFNFGNTGSGVQGDVNDDGVVNDSDLLVVLFNFGQGC